MRGDDFEAWREAVRGPSDPARPSIGEAVEVLVIRPSATGEPWPGEEAWLPATVTHSTDAEIGVAFSDSERLALPRRSGRVRWRLP
jgi:hypothetical protein